LYFRLYTAAPCNAYGSTSALTESDFPAGGCDISMTSGKHQTGKLRPPADEKLFWFNWSTKHELKKT